MKFPGGNQLLFCEQVGTVTSFFEQWNDCERTVVLYALLKRVPFANLKFLQLSIDYNLAQNYSSQSKLQLLETHANNANFLNKLVQRYQNTSTITTTGSCCVGGSAGDTNASTTILHNNNNNNTNHTNNNNNNTSIANNNLTISDSYTDSEKKNSAYDLSSTSSSSCSSSSGVSSGSSVSQTASSLSSSSSSSSSTNGQATANSKTQESSHKATTGGSKAKPVESKKDILNDMLTYLPLLKPGNDDVKSVYMSLIPAAVEDACQQAVPTELVQHILSYLLIHPAVNNDDRR